MQRLFFSYSPRFTRSSQFAGHVEWPHISQLALMNAVEWPHIGQQALMNGTPINFPIHAGNRGLSHWVNGNHPYWRLENSERQLRHHHNNWRNINPYYAYEAPIYRHCQIAYVDTCSRNHTTMSSMQIKSPKRERTPSDGRQTNPSKLQRTKEKELQPESRSSSSKNTESTVSLSSSGRGLTQRDWPKSSEECSWRRAGKEFQSSAAANTSSSRWDQREKRTRNPPASTSRPDQSDCNIRVTVTGNKRVPTSNPSDAPAPPPPPPGQYISRVSGDKRFPPPTSKNATSYTQPRPAISHNLERHQGFHSSAGSGQGQNPSDGSRTYTRRLWVDVQKPGSYQSSRPGQPASRGGGKNDRPFDFSVLSYNILAQGLLESNSYLYRHCPADTLPWEFRKCNILAEITAADADVICLQEVQSDHFIDFFKPELGQLGYAAIYKKRTGDKGDGCATFYKKSLFRHVFHSRLEYQRQSGCLDRDNVAVIVMLQPKSFPATHQVCVANTHLLWNPRRGDVKLAQLEIEHISHINSTAPIPAGTYHPIILCGDFNSLPHCPLYKFIKKGHVTYEGMAMVDVSGQQDGKKRYMESPLWPQNIGVTQRCLYVHRDGNAGNGNSGNAWQTQENYGFEGDRQSDSRIVYQPGDLHHPFFFSSVYEHNHGNREVTTNNSQSNCTVDYIFFTRGNLPRGTGSNAGASAQQPNFSSNLSVTRRLSLYTDNEVRSMGGLPNAKWSSDHLSLQAKFSMTPIFR